VTRRSNGGDRGAGPRGSESRIGEGNPHFLIDARPKAEARAGAIKGGLANAYRFASRSRISTSSFSSGLGPGGGGGGGGFFSLLIGTTMKK